MSDKKRREEKAGGFGKSGTPINILVAFLLTGICIVFEVLCLKYFKTGFIARHVHLLIAIACAVTIVYCLVAVLCTVKGKDTVYRILFSGFLLALFFLVLLFVLQRTGFLEIFRDPDLYREYLERAGIWMPLLYIVLQYLQVVVLPIPGFVSTVAGVALFGPTKAMLCSLVGILLGSLTAFVIGRKIGYKAVAWIVGQDDLDKWLKKVKGKDNFILTVMFVLPLFPDDILCFIAGLSSMSWQYFVVMTVIARSIGIAGTCYSINFIPFNTWWGILIWAVLIAAIIAAFVLLYKHMDAVNDWFNKKFRIGRRKGTGSAKRGRRDETRERTGAEEEGSEKNSRTGGG